MKWSCLCFSGGKEHYGDMQYYPFRMTPYLMKVQDAELSEEQFCCLLLAERVHSGYEGETTNHCIGPSLLLYKFDKPQFDYEKCPFPHP